MGLDSEELILEAEQAFGISFAADEMAKVATAGQFYDAIIRRLPGPEKRRCLWGATFYRLRPTLLTVTGRERREVRPRTRVEILIPRKRRKAMWKEMQRLSGLRFPHLRLPNWCVYAAVIAFALIVAPLALVVDWPWYWLLIPPGWIVLILAVLAVDAIFGTELPNYAQTVGCLTRAVLAKNFAKLATEADYDYNEIWQSVRILVAEQLDVELETVTREARLVADLGMK